MDEELKKLSLSLGHQIWKESGLKNPSVFSGGGGINEESFAEIFSIGYCYGALNGIRACRSSFEKKLDETK